MAPVHKAVVKNVLSGDTVILRGNPRPNGPPPERLFALSNVQAPRLGNKDRDDEVKQNKLLPFILFIVMFQFRENKREKKKHIKMYRIRKRYPPTG